MKRKQKPFPETLADLLYLEIFFFFYGDWRETIIRRRCQQASLLIQAQVFGPIHQKKSQYFIKRDLDKNHHGLRKAVCVSAQFTSCSFPLLFPLFPFFPLLFPPLLLLRYRCEGCRLQPCSPAPVWSWYLVSGVRACVRARVSRGGCAAASLRCALIRG